MILTWYQVVKRQNTCVVGGITIIISQAGIGNHGPLAGLILGDRPMAGQRPLAPLI